MLRSFLITILLCSSFIASQTCTNPCTPYTINIISDPTKDQAVGTCSSVLAPPVLVPITGTSWKKYTALPGVAPGSNAEYITDCISSDPNVYTKDSVRFITRTFELSCPPTVAYMNCKATATTELYVNGVLNTKIVCKSPELNVLINSNDAVVLDNLQEGVNVLEWRIASKGKASSTFNSNPNGLLYDLKIVRS